MNLAEGENKSDDYLAGEPDGVDPHHRRSRRPGQTRDAVAVDDDPHLRRRNQQFMPDHLAIDVIFWRNTMSIATDMTGVLMAILTIGRMENPHQPANMDDFGARYALSTIQDGLAEQKYAGAGEI